MAASPAGSVVSAGLEDSPSGKSHILLHRSVPSGSFCGMLGSPSVSYFRNPWESKHGPSLGCSGSSIVVFLRNSQGPLL